MHTRRFVLSLVVVLVGAAGAFAEPIVQITSSNSTGILTAQSFSYGPGVTSSLIGGPPTNNVVATNLATAFSGPFTFGAFANGAIPVGDLTKTITAGAGSISFSLSGMSGVIFDNAGMNSTLVISGHEALTGNTSGFDLGQFGPNSVFSLALPASGFNFAGFIGSGSTSQFVQSGAFNQFAVPAGAAVVPEPGTLALWTSLAAAAFFIRRRRSR